MGASEQAGGAITVSRDGVTVEKRLVEDEFPIPTITFRIVNERNDTVAVTLSETVPDDFSIGTLGFHPDHGSEFWTCLDDEKAEFHRALEARAEAETLYGIRIDDLERASAFMTDPDIESVTPVDPDDIDDPIVEAEGEPDDTIEATAADVEDADENEAEQNNDRDANGANEDEEPVTLSLDEEEAEAIIADDKADSDGASGETDGPTGVDNELPDGDIDLSGVSAPENDALHVEEVLGTDDPDLEVSVPTNPNEAGPETGALIDRLVEELERADVDPEQKAVLREELDVGVPSETRARIDSLRDRVETLGAYTDSLEEFLDENGTAQELLAEFETQVEALRDDVATIRHHTRANASDIGELNGTILDLEDHVEDVEDRLESVAEHAEMIEGDLAETDDHIDSVETDLTEAEESIADNEDDIAALDEHLVEVDDELTAVEDRVSTTEEDVDALEALAEDLQGDLSGVERRVTATEADAWAHDDRLDDAQAALADLESETADLWTELDEKSEAIRADLDAETDDIRTDLDEELTDVRDDLAGVEDDVDELLTWRDELGEMFQ